MRTSTIDEEVLIRHVEKICKSPEFRSKQVLCRFLSYIVSETLAGRGENIKAFSIGVDVFNKDEDFDPGQDTLVRINAGRLRRMLDLYYSKTGKNDDLRIVIPKGGYIPEIIWQSLPADEEGRHRESEKEPGKSLEPSVAVLSFNDLTGDPTNAYFARGFSYELLMELSKFEDLQVYNFLSVSDHPESGTGVYRSLREKGIRFTIGGAIHGDRERMNVLAELRDLNLGKQIWSEKYRKEIRADNLIEIQESIAAEISGKLGDEYGIILNRLSQDSQGQKPLQLSTYTAVLKYYNYLVHNTPETVAEAFEALNRAVEKDPRSGIAMACLAVLHGTAYSLDYPDAEKSYACIGEMSEQAYLLDPNNLFVQLSLMYKCFLYEEKERFFHLADRILERNPRSTLRLGALGFYLSLYGDWERGKQILDSVMKGHLEYPRYFHGATALYYYRQKDYPSALNEANLYHVPGFFWGHMLRAAILGQLGRKEEAQKALDRVKQIKPDFEAKRSYLISRFVKEESLVNHILEGLSGAV